MPHERASVGLTSSMIRGWQFHLYDIPYLRRAIAVAAEHKVNHIQLTHDIVMYLKHINNNPTRERQVNDLVDQAHRRGMEAFVMIHTISYLPSRFLTGHRANLDDPRFWTYEREQYQTVFRKCPNIDGIALSFGDACHYHIYNDNQVSSAMTPSERLLQYIETVWEVCDSLGKTLYVRDWAGSGATVEAIMRAPAGVRVMTKSDIGDWQQTDPHNPLLGAFGDRHQIVEMDLCGEYLGRSWVHWGAPEYVAYRLRHALSRGVKGAVGRVDAFDLGHHLEALPYGVPSSVGGTHALGTPNDVNIFAFCRLLENPDADPEGLWQEWAAARFGERAAPYVVSALRRSFEIADTVLWSRDYVGLAGVIPTVGQLEAIARDNALLGRPIQAFMSGDDLESVVEDEFRRGLELCRECLKDLEAGQSFIHAADYQVLVEGFEKYVDLAEAWKQIYRVFVRYKVAQLSGSPSDYELLSVELQRLLDLARTIERVRGNNSWPANAARMRRFISEIREIMNYLQKQLLRRPEVGLHTSLFIPR